MRSIEYAKNVVSGKQIAGKYLKLAAQRYLDDLKRDDLVFDRKKLKKIHTILETKFYVPELKAPSEVYPPHLFWIDQLYGFYYKETGIRRFREVYLQVARKNFKTYFAAVISLIELLFYSDDYPEILQGANSREQALICTNKTAEIIKSSPFLAKLYDKEKNRGKLRIYTNRDEANKITLTTSNRKGIINAMPKDPGDGGNPSVGIVDEYHEAKTNKLLETIKSGQGMRKQPVTVVITSPGSNRDGPCYSLRTSGAKLLEGDIENDTFLPVIFELDHESEWDDIEMLEKSNPMMPYSPTVRSFLKERIKEAKIKGGSTEANVKIKNAGIWIDSPDIWLNSEIVSKNNFNLSGYEKEQCFVGFDLAKGMDLNALCILTPFQGKFVAEFFYWIPTDKFDTDEVDYRKWADEGWLRTQEGNAINHWDLGQEVADILKQRDVNNNVVSIGYDQRYSLLGVVPILEREGFLHKCKVVGQGYNLSQSTLQVEQWINQERMDLLNNPIIHWNFRNTTLAQGGRGDVYPDKMKSVGKIDGVVALVIATHEYLRFTGGEEPEVYEFILLE